ncbi:MAG: FAD-dependent oxidoreductase [Spirochaetota bacterium]|nr:FAD-dependent oxidoreductase [Spirochaetota bacterium]
MKLDMLFSPIKIRNMEVKNRIVMPAMGTFYTLDGTITERFQQYYLRRARGGVGLMIVGPMAMDKAGGGPFMIGIEEDRFVPSMTKFIEELHQVSDLKVAAQLYQAGRYAYSFVTGMPSLSASAIPSKLTKETPREMTQEDISDTINNYIASAKRVKESGFDAVEILACTGYLICQFLSPITNNRTDKYGGSLENRMRFPLEIISAVRGAIGNDFPVIARVAGNDFMPGSLTNKEARVVCKEFQNAGIDAINVTGGWHETRVPQLTSNVPRGAFVYLAQGIKEAVSIPVFASNRLGDPFLADKTIRQGSADMICWGRPLLADPDIPNKSREGRFNEIIHCISCNQACFDNIFSGKPVSCMVNPCVGREGEEEYNPKPAEKIKRVLVIGGGPSGMKAAVTAANRGHNVHLWERSTQLGGQINIASLPLGKREFANVVKDLSSQLQLSGVETMLETEATAERIKKENFDVVIVATGAVQVKPSIPGMDKPHVIGAWEALADPIRTNHHVVVIGGNGTGLETALEIAKVGTIEPEIVAFLLENEGEDLNALSEALTHGTREVTVIEMLSKMGADIGRTFRWSLIQDLRRHGIAMMSDSKVIAIEDDHVMVDTEEGQKNILANTVVIATGVKPLNQLYDDIKDIAEEVYLIGDAKSPRKILDAIVEGYEVGLNI